ncbi:unnamed protein product [Paramecium octaurelia]|uniref:Uncharacterized protein n=1 Tax=Paramecium octaurelia TaxID=43137 RepID=A0A8S1RTJ7_PAROT|nr:unnamed protein product [Paramecium octaurelia]CAD8132281.1 unnamed protein product [Paramecium octaurelia]CAD8132285.1 unnamed protein product [Paramecium octaurelia]
MDCVKFMNVVCVFAIPFFISLYFIVEFQPNFYKYPKSDPKKLKEAIIVALILHIILSIVLTLWHQRRVKAKKQMQKIGDNYYQIQGNIQGSQDSD